MARLDAGALGGNLGLAVRRAHGAIGRHYGEHCADLGLTQKQVSVLWLAGDHPGLAQADLADTLDMDRATTMALVHGLEARGLLSRTADAADRRRIAFRLTDAGTALLTRAKDAILAHETWLGARYTADERAILTELLSRIYR